MVRKTYNSHYFGSQIRFQDLRLKSFHPSSSVLSNWAKKFIPLPRCNPLRFPSCIGPSQALPDFWDKITPARSSRAAAARVTRPTPGAQQQSLPLLALADSVVAAAMAERAPAAVGPAVFVNAGYLTLTHATATGSTATAGGAGTGLSGHNGSAGTANSTSLFNYAGTVNGSGTTGPLTLLDPPAPVSVLTSVPTLNEWMLMLLACLRLGIGWKKLHNMGN
jgi:hypothetical protein